MNRFTPLPPVTAADHRAVLELLELYFDAFHRSDAAQLGSLFHPSALYGFVEGEQLRRLDMPTYLPLVASRPSPAAAGRTRDDRVLALDFAGPTTALARVECNIFGKHFVDFLSLLRIEGRWQIVAKVFHVDVEEAR